jgi:5-methyltetrahydrofolate--homocysteine methyltransferase
MRDHLEKIKNAVVSLDRTGIEGHVRAALAAGIDVDRIINEALTRAMDVVGKDFTSGKIFVPELLVAALTMKAALEVVKPMLKGARQFFGTVIIGTVMGDLHDIGKNLVGIMLEGAGFQVIDLGVNVDAQRFVQQVEKFKPTILGLSALLTTTMPEMGNVIKLLETKGLRNETKVIVGGAPVDAAFAANIGADGYAREAGAAVELAKRLVPSTAFLNKEVAL